MADVPLPLSGRRSGPPGSALDRAGWRWTLTLSYAGALIVLAVVPSPAPYVAPGVSDTILHAGGYGVLAFLVAWASQASAGQVVTAALVGIVGGTGLGILTELLQGLVPWRNAELRDVGSDLLGALIGVTFWLVIAWIHGRWKGSPP